jgi:hypothetical protein
MCYLASYTGAALPVPGGLDIQRRERVPGHYIARSVEAAGRDRNMNVRR